jgi:hypothetical protein
VLPRAQRLGGTAALSSLAREAWSEGGQGFLTGHWTRGHSVVWVVVLLLDLIVGAYHEKLVDAVMRRGGSGSLP